MDTPQKYWHELSSLNRSEAKQRLQTDKAIQENYLAPVWCGLGSNALLYMEGCWSLLLNEDSVNEKYCSCNRSEEDGVVNGCDFYNPVDSTVEKK